MTSGSCPARGPDWSPPRLYGDPGDDPGTASAWNRRPPHRAHSTLPEADGQRHKADRAWAWPHRGSPGHMKSGQIKVGAAGGRYPVSTQRQMDVAAWKASAGVQLQTLNQCRYGAIS